MKTLRQMIDFLEFHDRDMMRAQEGECEHLPEKPRN